MIRSRLGLKALVLSGFVLGLMALGAAGAQAEPNSKWLVSGVDVADTLPQLVIKQVENNSAVLEFKTKAGTEVEILCTDGEFDTGGKLAAEGGITLGTIVFTGCLVNLNKVFAKNCKPHSSGKPDGEILTAAGKGLLLLDKLASGALTDLTIIKPDVGKVFVIIEMGELCAIGEKVNVETATEADGLWLKDIGGNTGALESKAVHLIVEADSPLHKLLALGQPALILGSAEVELGSGLPWKGDWN